MSAITSLPPSTLAEQQPPSVVAAGVHHALDESMAGLSLDANTQASGYHPASQPTYPSYPSYQRPPHLSKELPQLPVSPTHPTPVQGELSQGLQAQRISLQLEANTSFADELGSYLSDQEALQTTPSLKEAIHGSSPPSSAHFVAPPGSAAVVAANGLPLSSGAESVHVTIITTTSSGSPVGPSVGQPVVTASSDIPRYQLSDTPVATSPPQPSGSISPTNGYYPHPPIASQGMNHGLSQPGAAAPWSSAPQQQQQQQPLGASPPLVYTYAQPQQPYLPQQNTYLPPPVLIKPGEGESPSSLVPALGIPSPIQYPGVAGDASAVPWSSLPPPGMGPPSPAFAMSDRAPSPSRASLSSDDNYNPRSSFQQHLRTGSHGRSIPGSGRTSPMPLALNNGDFLKPVAAKSDDWAALIDAPASPITPYSQGVFRAMVGGPGLGFTDSPAEEMIHSADYLQHASRPTSFIPQQQHAYTDPGMYRHQQHSSTSGMPMPMPMPGNMGPADPNMMGGLGARQHQRKSWSPNTVDPLDGIQTPPNPPFSTNGAPGGSFGYHTPPRTRTTVHSKQNSVATSVSLLSDAAIVAKYREMAIKTNDTSLQMSYAKYLLEIGESSSTYTPVAGSDSTNMSSTSPTSTSPTTASATSGPSTPGQEEGDSIGRRKLTQEAIYWVDRLSKEGQPEAQFIRGTWYEDGLYGNKKSADKALRLFQSASKGDYAAAHYKVGYYCERRKDSNKAVVLYKKAATHNDVPANHRLAIVYLYGELGQAKNMKTGLQYLKRAASFATEASPMSPYVLGQILAREYKQLTIPDDIAFPDDGEALEWFRKSALLGYGPANCKMGHCYEYGTLGCKVDPFMSVQHYERALLTSDSNGEADMALSGWYLSGAEGCFEANDALAFQYASKAAEKQLPKAQYAMGYYHEVGISVPIDLGKAMEFYKLAAANGSKEAKTRLEEQATKFDMLGHKNSIRRIKQGRSSKDQSCIVM